MKKNIDIELDKLLLVEGTHEVAFFGGLLKSMGLGEHIQVIDVGGQNNFRSNITYWSSNPAFRNAKTISIVRDADENPSAKHQSIRETLKDNGLPYPIDGAIFSNTQKPNVGIYLLPNNSSQGCLETLCLEIVKDEPVMACVESYIQCTNQAPNVRHGVSQLAKAKVQTFLASKQGGDVYMASAIKLGIWNFNSPALENLRAFISTM